MTQVALVGLIIILVAWVATRERKLWKLKMKVDQLRVSEKMERHGREALIRASQNHKDLDDIIKKIEKAAREKNAKEMHKILRSVMFGV